MSTPPTLYDAWAELRHGGMFISPARLPEYFPDPPPPLPYARVSDLRRITSGLATLEDHLEHIDALLEQILDLHPSRWLKGSRIDTKWTRRSVTGEPIRPQRLWLTSDHEGDPLPVFIEDPTSITRLGIGRGRRSTTRVLEWLRQTHLKVALLTNGQQWRVMYAGEDHDAWVESEAQHWLSNDELTSQVHALRTLLSKRSLTRSEGDTVPPLHAAIQASRRGQAELSSTLGERVRKAVEHLVRESDPAIRELKEREQKGDVSRRVTNRDLYLAACRVIMRQVVILFAESRNDLLPLDNPVYFHNYSLRGLHEQLEQEQGSGALHERHHAWPRTLALFSFIGSPGRAACSTRTIAGGPSAKAVLASDVRVPPRDLARSSLILHDLRALAMRTVSEPRLSASSRNNSLNNHHVVTTAHSLARFTGRA